MSEIPEMDIEYTRIDGRECVIWHNRDDVLRAMAKREDELAALRKEKEQLGENTLSAMKGGVYFGMTTMIQGLIFEKNELRQVLTRAAAYVRGNPELMADIERVKEATKEEVEHAKLCAKYTENEYKRLERRISELEEWEQGADS